MPGVLNKAVFPKDSHSTISHFDLRLSAVVTAITYRFVSVRCSYLDYVWQISSGAKGTLI